MSGFHIETGGFQYAAAIDARHRWHDMAAGVTLKKSLTEQIRNIRKVWARFGSFRLETEITEGTTWLLEPRLGMNLFLNPATTEVSDYLSQ